MMIERRNNAFVERLSFWLVVFSAMGAALVLLDPVVAFELPGGSGAMIKLGGNGFSDQMKGAVVMLVLIAGFTATVNYWLGASNSGDKAQDSVNNIAASAAPTQAAAVAAATGAPLPAPATDSPIQTETVTVNAATANVAEVQPTEGAPRP